MRLLKLNWGKSVVLGLLMVSLLSSCSSVDVSDYQGTNPP